MFGLDNLDLINLAVGCGCCRARLSTTRGCNTPSDDADAYGNACVTNMDSGEKYKKPHRSGSRTEEPSGGKSTPQRWPRRSDAKKKWKVSRRTTRTGAVTAKANPPEKQLPRDSDESWSNSTGREKR
ncbi:hypothetical protein KQX54_019136 [Cotesia glomerata]|uniref:Uncharacterized protein n=1 Tax=Cotesia glomerata TaxID=32391 RepID=A0AAV7IFG5_COTGL|nr:hypothetical protein KQX54_019136 [Cotesia glomerata]